MGVTYLLSFFIEKGSVDKQILIQEVILLKLYFPIQYKHIVNPKTQHNLKCKFFGLSSKLKCYDKQ